MRLIGVDDEGLSSIETKDVEEEGKQNTNV